VTYQSKLYAEHGLKAGCQVLRLSATLADGRKHTALYLYTTGASFAEDDLKKLPDFRREYVAWDGVESVSFDCGD
jgi:hypothetical protein